MEIIEFDRWKPSLDNPRKLEYVGQRTAEEVFSELKHRLEGMGYLPDEYFEMRGGWENGREIPGTPACSARWTTGPARASMWTYT